jgi:hypothetical protein
MGKAATKADGISFKIVDRVIASCLCDGIRLAIPLQHDAYKHAVDGKYARMRQNVGFSDDAKAFTVMCR